MTESKFRLPTRGALNPDLDEIEPGARPKPSRGRRKIPVARRSRQRVAPDHEFFYWCAYCDYCNTDDEGQRALCPDHRAEKATSRKAAYRDPTGAASEADGDDGHQLTEQQLAALWAKAQALHRAQQRHERAIRDGNPDKARRDLDKAIKDLLALIGSLPKPPASR